MEPGLTLNPLPATEVKQSSFLIILLSSLLIISCLIAGFFAWQTQRLVKQLSESRNQNLAMQTPTPTPDPTAGWKTYVNTDAGVSFKYPQEMMLAEEQISTDDKLGDVEISTGSKDDGEKLIFNISRIVEQSDIYINTRKFEDTDPIFNKNDSETNIEWVGYYKNAPIQYLSIVKNNARIYSFGITPIENPNTYNDQYRKLLTNIASTFEIMEINAPPTEIACTMDAKICPDGSAVGRSGPKCEFAPCPTTSP